MRLPREKRFALALFFTRNISQHSCSTRLICLPLVSVLSKQSITCQPEQAHRATPVWKRASPDPVVNQVLAFSSLTPSLMEAGKEQWRPADIDGLNKGRPSFALMTGSAKKRSSVSRVLRLEHMVRTGAGQSRCPLQGPCWKGKAVQGLASPHSPDPFIVATDRDSIRPDVSSRKRIRHHVMRGKNRKEVSPQQRTIGSWVNHGHDAPSASAIEAQPALSLAPQVIGSTRSAIGLQLHVDPSAMQLIHDCRPALPIISQRNS